MPKDPVWKRVLGGLIGVAIAVTVLILLRQRGVSRDSVEQFEIAAVIAAGAVGLILWHRKRSRS